MRERTIRVLMDKKNNRFAIHDVVTGDLLHIFYPTRDISEMSPQQVVDNENEAIRDFAVNGSHGDEDDSENELGW